MSSSGRYRLYRHIVLAVLGSVLIVFFVVGFVPQWFRGFEKQAGPFGDSFGFVNSMFSALAFAGLLITLLIQINEFHLAQDERAENLTIQQKISEQQFFSSLVSAIGTWKSIHGEPSPPLREAVRESHLIALTTWKTNAVILDVATEYMMSAAMGQKGADIIAKFHQDQRLATARVNGAEFIVICRSVLKWLCDQPRDAIYMYQPPEEESVYQPPEEGSDANFGRAWMVQQINGGLDELISISRKEIEKLRPPQNLLDGDHRFRMYALVHSRARKLRFQVSRIPFMYNDSAFTTADLDRVIAALDAGADDILCALYVFCEHP